MHEGVVFEMPEFGICRNAGDLVCEIAFIPDAMFMEAWLPDFTGKSVSGLEGEAALDALSAAFAGLIGSGREQRVKVVRHDGEAVKEVAALITIAKEGLRQEFGECRHLEQSAAFVGCGGQSVSWHGNARSIAREGGRLSGGLGCERFGGAPGPQERASGPSQLHRGSLGNSSFVRSTA